MQHQSLQAAMLEGSPDVVRPFAHAIVTPETLGCVIVALCSMLLDLPGQTFPPDEAVVNAHKSP